MCTSGSSKVSPQYKLAKAGVLQRLPHHNRPGAPAKLLDRCVNVVIISVCLQLGGLEHCFGLAVSCDTGVHGRCPSGGSTGQRLKRG